MAASVPEESSSQRLGLGLFGAISIVYLSRSSSAQQLEGLMPIAQGPSYHSKATERNALSSLVIVHGRGQFVKWNVNE